MTWTDYLIGPNGTKIPLSDLGADVTGVSDIPAEYVTTRGYHQHGVTVQYAQLAARTLSFTCEVAVRHSAGLQAQRDRLIGVLSPAKAPDDMVTFRRVLSTGQRRDIRGLVQQGMAFETFWDRSGFTASFTLLCPDPTFYDPNTHTETLEAEAVAALVVPFSVPGDLWIGSGTQITASVTNAGSWLAYPTLTVVGPYQRLRLENQTTGAYLTLGVAAAAGETVEVVLTPGQQTIVHEDVLALDDLEDGDLVHWLLAPGVNAIRGSGVGMSDRTRVTLSYAPRYIAI